MPTYKGIEMPANNADKIGAMIESAKNKLMGTPVGDFVRGVGAVGTIPNTIVAGTQNSYGANIPTVEDTRQKLVESTPSAGGIIKDAATGASRIFNNVNTPTLGATVNQQSSSDTSPADLGKPNNGAIKDERSFSWPLTSGISMSKPESGLGALILPDYKTREDIAPAIASSSYNPNDDKFAGLMKDLIDTASSGSPSVERATKLNALKTGIQALAPMTSFGQFGVAGLQAETTRRGQDIGADTTKRGQDIGAGTIRRGQDIGAETKASELALQAKDFETLARLRGATAAKSQAEADILNEQGKPDKVREREATGWLAERRKVINASLADLEGLPEEEKTKKMNARVADYNKYNPPPIRSAKKNTDGTVTVQYADGTVKTGKPVK